MSNFYEDASVVMVPSGYKDQKVYSSVPDDGSADLTFSRSNDTATRVGPDGLIEKVRTNYILQSNSFDTTWITTDLTVTSGATDPNGGTTAWTIANTAASGIIQQAATLAGLRSVSIYAKAGTHRYLYMGVYVGSGTQSYQNFDLQDGVITSGTQGRIESIGGGWYRCTSYGADGTTGGVQIIPSNNSSGASTTNGNILIWNCQYEGGDIATDYIPTTTSAVSVGPLSNIPRLDYSGGANSPSLLLEPQRTNTAYPSEDFSGYTSSSTTIVSNQAVSPDGYTNADLIYPTSSGSFAGKYKTLAPSTTGVVSCFVKQAGKRYAIIGTDNTAPFTCVFDLQTATVVYEATNYTGKIESYGNGWYRISATYTSSAGNVYPFIGVADAANGSVTVDGTNGLYIWGFQYELDASYATSYIPTLSAAVTRGADVASKTGISSLIGQTEGTMYSEFIVNGFADYGTPLCINNGSTNESIWLTTFANGDIRAEVFSSTGGGIQASFIKSGNVTGQVYKIAIGYASNNFAFYVNGTQVGSTDTSGSVPVGIDRIDFDYANATSFVKSALEIKQALVFKTRLSNDSLSLLTTL